MFYNLVMATMPVSPSDFERDFSVLLDRLREAAGSVLPRAMVPQVPARETNLPREKDLAYPLTL